VAKLRGEIEEIKGQLMGHIASDAGKSRDDGEDADAVQMARLLLDGVSCGPSALALLCLALKMPFLSCLAIAAATLFDFPVASLTPPAVFALGTPKAPLIGVGDGNYNFTYNAFFSFPHYSLTSTRAECGIKPHSQSWSSNHGNGGNRLCSLDNDSLVLTSLSQLSNPGP
jgi:hypothetical protein